MKTKMTLDEQVRAHLAFLARRAAGDKGVTREAFAHPRKRRLFTEVTKLFQRLTQEGVLRLEPERAREGEWSPKRYLVTRAP